MGTTVLLVLLAVASTASAGLELDMAHVRAGGSVRRALVGLIVANVLLVPLTSLATLHVIPLASDVRLALTVVALAPGGATAPLLARLAGGEPTRIALGYVVLVVASALLAVGFSALTPGAAPASKIGGVMAVQLGPVIVGAWLRASRPSLASRVALLARNASSLLLATVVVALAVTRGQSLATLGIAPIAAMMAMVVLTLACGAAVAPPPRAPDALLACVRNLTLALLLVEVSSPGGRATLVVAAYGLLMYGAAAVVAASARARA